MLVPLELSIISQKKGYISPELAIGWRVGNYAREFFGTIQEALIAVRVNDDAATALRWFVSRSLPGDVTLAGQERAWDFMIYHPGTGTLLQMVKYNKTTDLSLFIKSIGDHLSKNSPSLISDYRNTMNDLIANILSNPIENMFLIIEHRCRRIVISKDIPIKCKCISCGTTLLNDEIWEIDGALTCLGCSVMEKSWFMYH